MPRTQTITKTVYAFDELTDDAKERARDWYRGCIDEYDYEFTLDDFITIAQIIGISFATHDVKLMSGKTRSEPNIYWSGFASQGDGACFEGTYSYAPEAPARIRQHLSDEEILRITDELNAIQCGRILLNRPTWEAEIRKTSSHYCHEHTVSIEVLDADDGDCTVEEGEAANRDELQIAELMRDLMRWFYKQLEAENDWLYSAECVDENIRCNDYEFTEGGEIA